MVKICICPENRARILTVEIRVLDTVLEPHLDIIMRNNNYYLLKIDRTFPLQISKADIDGHGTGMY